MFLEQRLGVGRAAAGVGEERDIPEEGTQVGKEGRDNSTQLPGHLKWQKQQVQWKHQQDASMEAGTGPNHRWIWQSRP